MSRFQLHIRSALFLAIAAATAIATLAPVLSLRGSLEPLVVRAVDLGFSFTSTAQDAAALQRLATARLLSLLLIVAASACAVAVVTLLTLTWTRSTARAVDVPIRRAVGASRRDLALGFLGEAAAITCSAIPVGLLLGWVALRIAARSWPGQPVPLAFAGAIVAIPVALALVGGSLLPLRHARGRRLVNLPANPLGLFPPILQVAVSLGILLGATLVSQQAARLLGPGNTAPEGTVFALAADDDPAQRAALYLDLLRDLERQGITASLTSPGMMLGLGTVDWVETDCGQCLTGGFYLKWHNERATHHLVSPDTFTVLGMPMVAGRAFTLADNWNAPHVAIVNRQMAARHFEDGKPLGRQIFIGKERIPYTVVGVVDDGGAVGLTGGVQSRFAIYLSSLQVPIAAADLAVQGHDAGDAALTVLGRTAHLSHDAGSSMAEVRQQFTAPLGWFSRWIRIEALAALLAGALGAMVSIAIWANALVPELAIHRALGATRRRMVLHVLVRVLLVIGAGVTVALFATGPSLRAVLSEVLGDMPPLSLRASLTPSALLVVAAFLGAVPPLVRLLRARPLMQAAE